VYYLLDIEYVVSKNMAEETHVNKSQKHGRRGTY